MSSIHVVEVLEAVYRVELPPHNWLEGVLAAIAPHMDCGLGVAAYFVNAAAPDQFSTSGYVGTGLMGSAEGVQRFRQWEESVPSQVKRHIHLFGAGGTAASIPQLPSDPGGVAQTLRAHRYPSMSGLNAIDASGLGCALAAAVPAEEQRRFPFGSKVILDRVASHVAAGARILQSLRRQSEAVISPTGVIQHAEGPAESRVARDALRNAARDVDRVRARSTRMTVKEVTELWQALVAGRWSLVDSFESDGRRYYLARPNDPVVPQHRLLSEREAQVVAGATMGHSNKVLAYELGLSTSSVATHLKRAREKLGVASRVELIRAYQELMQRA